MNATDLIIQVRQRSPWEAIDTGFILVRAVWRSILPAWLALLAGLVLLCALLIPRDYFWAASIVLWWLKPLFDRVLLYTLSHQLFGQPLSSAEIFSAIPSLMRNTGLLGALSWRRFSFSRSYNLPIWQLEQLRGAARVQRQKLLYLQGHSTAVGLTFACILLELIITFSLYALILLFDPSEQAWEHLISFFSDNSTAELRYLMELIGLVIQAFAILLIEPFFVAAGFALYLNRRTQLEAWDIEITFRSLGARLQQLARNTPAQQAGRTVLTLLGSVLLFSALTAPSGVQASESEFLHPTRLPVSASSHELEQVMQVDELDNIRPIKTWMPRDKDQPDTETELAHQLIQLLSTIFKYLIWALVFIALFLGLIYRKRILALLKPAPKASLPPTQPAVLFGLDIRPESLPDDIAGAARAHWQAGENRAALSLLYRGTLMQLTRHDAISVSASDTEGDILHSARPQLAPQRFAYLAQLTRCWQTIAYAHRIPADTEVTPLFDSWQQWTATATNPRAAVDTATATTDTVHTAAGEPGR